MLLEATEYLWTKNWYLKELVGCLFLFANILKTSVMHMFFAFMEIRVTADSSSVGNQLGQYKHDMQEMMWKVRKKI